MLVASVFFVLQAAVFKWTTAYLPPVEMMVWRNAGAFVFLYAWSRLKGTRIPAPSNPGLLLVRATFGTIAMLGYFYALYLLPMAEVVVIHKTAPFIILILARFFLGETISRYHLLAFAIAMAGVWIVFQPGLGRYGLVLFLPLLAAFFSAVAHTSLRRLNETDQPVTIVAGFFLISIPILVPLMLVEGFILPGTVLLWGMVLSVGLFTMIAQVAMTYAYRYGKAGEVALYSYSSVPLAALAGVVIFGDIPDTGTIIGSIWIIVAAVIMNSQRFQTDLKTNS